MYLSTYFLINLFIKNKTPIHQALPVEETIYDVPETHFCEICEKILVGRRTWHSEFHFYVLLSNFLFLIFFFLFKPKFITYSNAFNHFTHYDSMIILSHSRIDIRNDKYFCNNKTLDFCLCL